MLIFIMLFLWILLGTDAQSGTGTSGGSGGFGGGGVGLTGVGVHGGALGGVAGLGRGTGITSGLNNNLLSRSATSVYPGLPPGLPTWYRRHLWGSLGGGRGRQGHEADEHPRLPQSYHASRRSARHIFRPDDPLAGTNRAALRRQRSRYRSGSPLRQLSAARDRELRRASSTPRENNPDFVPPPRTDTLSILRGRPSTDDSSRGRWSGVDLGDEGASPGGGGWSDDVTSSRDRVRALLRHRLGISVREQAE